MIIATPPSSFATFINGSREFILDERDERSYALEKVDFSRVRFISGLRGEDKQYDRGAGEMKLLRLKQSGYLLYGFSVCVGLWENHKRMKDWSVLERNFRKRGIEWISFFGDILRNLTINKRCVPVLWRIKRDGIVRWHRDIYWLDFTWSNKHLTAVSS